MGPSYDGPCLDDDGTVTPQFVEAMVEHFRNQKMIHKKFVVEILNQVAAIFEPLANCQEVRPRTAYFYLWLAPCQ